MGASKPVLTTRHLQDVVDEFLTFPAFAFDTETKGLWRLDPRRNEVFWIVLSGPGARTEVIPIGHPNGEQIGIRLEPRVNKNGDTRNFKVPDFGPPPKQLGHHDVMSALKPLFFAPNIRKWGANVKFDIESLAKYWGALPSGPFGDVQTLGHLLNENHRRYNLGDMVDRAFGRRYDKAIGAEVEKYPFSVAARYTHYDGFYTWLLAQELDPLVEAEKLDGERDLDFDLIEVLAAMEYAGIPLDVETASALDRELDRELVEVKRDLFEIAGREWNFDSNPQKQAIFYGPKSQGGRGLKPTKRTKGGAPSCDDEALKDHEGDELVDAFIRYGDLSKISGTYVKAYLGTAERKTKDKNKNQAPALAEDGRVHCNFRMASTVTGRLSCVAGSTLLPTSRGVFRFDEYEPEQGDLVFTHRQRWRPVVRKLYKGRREMLRVRLSNGYILDCTGAHRLATPSGWRYVRDLRAGSEVLVDERVSGVYARWVEGPSSAGSVHVGREANHSEHCQHGGHDVPNGATDCFDATGPRAVSGGESTAVLTLEDGRAEPYVGQEWFPASQPYRGCIRQGWSPSTQNEWQVRLSASAGDGRSVGAGRPARVGSGAPYRRGQNQQRFVEPSFDDESWARGTPLSTVEIREITSLGSMGVWDIEVAEDHSYAAQGFINHNCSEPNLQNIPRPDTELGKQIRSLFIAPPGHKFIVADFKQIEYVLMAHYSGDPVLQGFFNEGRDFHLAVASMILGIPESDVTKVQRTMAKNTNFAVAYGAGKDKVASMSHISIDAAEDFIKRHKKMLPSLYRFTAEVIRVCRSRPEPYVKTLLGRKRRLPAIRWSNDELRLKAERQAVNTVIQGSASDINKVAAIRLYEMLDPKHQPLLTVHDEFVISVPEDEVDIALPVVREAMLGIGVQELLRVPLDADIQVVERWSDAKG